MQLWGAGLFGHDTNTSFEFLCYIPFAPMLQGIGSTTSVPNMPITDQYVFLHVGFPA